MEDHLQKQFDLLECGHATFCPRCEKHIDGGLECEPTMEVHNLNFCPFRPDADPIKGGASKIRIGPEWQAVIPQVSVCYKLDGIVVPMPLTETQILETERDREKTFITKYPARNRIDGPSVKPPPVPVPPPVTTKVGRTVKPVEHFKPQ